MTEEDGGDSSVAGRVSTGIEGLDTILGGGFLRGGSYIFMGAPGAGKTIAASQACFRHVASGGRALYVTLLAESHGRLMANLRALDFFDASVVGGAFSLISGYRVLDTEGLPGLSKFLRQATRAHGATLLVIDGVLTAAGFAETELELKRFVHELHVAQDLVGCTTLLLTNALHESDRYPEQTMVDGLIELREATVGLRTIRELEVRKFRGSATVRGRHAFEIGGAGLTVYPRLEAEALVPPNGSGDPSPKRSAPRLAFGIESLDAMLTGGVPPLSTTLLFGTSGAGKTLLGLHFLEAGARRKEAGVYLGFSENAAEIVSKGEAFGLGLARHVDRGLLEILHQPSAEFLLDAVAARLLEAAPEGRVRRVFIDGLADLRRANFYPERIFGLFGALMTRLKARGITTIASEEPAILFGPEITAPNHVPVENLIFLRHVELQSRVRRLVSVLKMRGSGFDSSIREFVLTDKGILVAESFESADAILAGQARALTAKERSTKRASPSARRGRAR